ncbi:MAG TPA: response regulator [Longilinea sp.]|nr:response regulator [Longilinea sp.]
MAKYSILIIEDSMDSRRLLKAYLSTLDAELDVNLVPSAEEAFLIASKQPLDLLVTDYMLPGITGTDLVRRMRKRFPELKVILITALDPENVHKDVVELNIQHFLRKPLDINDFLLAVQKCLGIGEYAGTVPPAVSPQPATPSVSSPPATPIPSQGQAAAPRPVPEKPQPYTAGDRQVPSQPAVPHPATGSPGGAPFSPQQPTGQRATPPAQPVNRPVNQQPVASAQPSIPNRVPFANPAPLKIPAPPPVSPRASATLQLNNFLRELSEGLAAQTILLLDDQGEVITKVGDFPDPRIEFEWLPALRGAINESLKAKTVVSSVSSESALLFRGKLYELILTTVEKFALIIIIKTSQSKSRLWLALSQAMEAHSSLMLLLGKIGPALNERPPAIQPSMAIPAVRQPEPKPPAPEKTGEPAPDKDFERNLLRSFKQVTKEDADDFWGQNPTPPAKE